jgi:hypothetical protein
MDSEREVSSTKTRRDGRKEGRRRKRRGRNERRMSDEYCTLLAIGTW